MGQVSNESPVDDPEFSSPLTPKEKADYFVVMFISSKQLFFINVFIDASKD